MLTTTRRLLGAGFIVVLLTSSISAISIPSVRAIAARAT